VQTVLRERLRNVGITPVPVRTRVKSGEPTTSLICWPPDGEQRTFFLVVGSRIISTSVCDHPQSYKRIDSHIEQRCGSSMVLKVRKER
jgi:hypothetical protein